jgi:hypothetical protein
LHMRHHRLASKGKPAPNKICDPERDERQILARKNIVETCQRPQ